MTRERKPELPPIDVDGLGTTPLMRAAVARDSTPLMEMISSGNFRASLFVKDDKGRTALDWARMNRNEVAVAVLSKAMTAFINDARLDAIMDVNEMQAYLRASNAAFFETFVDLIRVQQHEQKAIDFMLTATLYRDQVEALEEMYFLDLQYGHREESPLMMAAGLNMTKLVHAMCENSVPVDKGDKYGVSPLCWAAASGHGDVVKALLFHGADVYHKSGEGRTALHYACLHSKPRIVGVLLDFMYERFSNYRMKHPKSKFDPSRWTKYATMMENFVLCKDDEGFKPMDLLPVPENVRPGLTVGGSRPLSLEASLSTMDATFNYRVDSSTVGSPGHQQPSGIDDPLHVDQGDRELVLITSPSAVSADEDGYHERPVTGGARLDALFAQDTVDFPKELVAGEALEGSMASPMRMDAGARSLSPTALLILPEEASVETGSDLPEPPSDAALGITRIRPTPTASVVSKSLASKSLASGSVEKDGSVAPVTPQGPGQDQDLDQDQLQASPSPHPIGGLGLGEGGMSVELSVVSGDFPNSPQADTFDIAASQTSSPQTTFHYPQFSHDTDKFEQGLHGITNIGSQSVYDSIARYDEYQRVFDLMTAATDRLSSWRAAAEIEQKLAQPVACTLHCGAQLRVENMLQHTRDECPRRLCKCDQCEGMVERQTLEKHMKYLCDKRRVACPNATFGCVEMPYYKNLQMHVDLRCLVRGVACRLNCGASVPIKDRDDHEMYHCKMRWVPCHQCNLEIIANNMAEHLHDQCLENPVTCPVSCGKVMPRKELNNHINLICKRLCKWGCGAFLGPAERINMHEVMVCSRRPRVCRNGCGSEGLTSGLIDEHESEQCIETLMRCPNGCGLMLRRGWLQLHIDPWRGSCAERRVRCPSNLTGWKIQMPGGEIGLVMKYSRDRSQTAVKYVDASLAETIVSLRSSAVNSVVNSVAKTHPTVSVGGPDGGSERRDSVASSVTASVVSQMVADADGHADGQTEPTAPFNADDEFEDASIATSVPGLEEGGQYLEEASLAGSTANAVSLGSVVQPFPGGQISQMSMLDESAVSSHPVWTPSWANYGVDRLYVRLEDRHVWVDYWTTPFLVLDRVQGITTAGMRKNARFECGWVVACELNEHLDEECLHRSIVVGKLDHMSTSGPVSLAEGLAMSVAATATTSGTIGTEPTPATSASLGMPVESPAALQSIERGQDDDGVTEMSTPSVIGEGDEDKEGSLYEPIDDPSLASLAMGSTQRKIFNDGSTVFSARTDNGQATSVEKLDEMLTLRAKIQVYNQEPPQLVTCEYCANEVPIDVMKDHVKDDCTKVHIRCKLGCGMRVTRGEMQTHMGVTCPKRDTPCPNCKEVMWNEEIPVHMSTYCNEAPHACELLCRMTGLTVRSEKLHRQHDCENRLVVCNCGESIVMCDMPDHKMADCTKKLGPCPQGCGAQVPRDELKEHMDQLCPNQTAWGMKYRNCPLGCKQRYMRKEMLGHIAFKCPLRLADCPMGCGNICKHDKLSTHLVYCPNRAIACDHDQAPCRCPLYEWFYKESKIEGVFSYQDGMRDDASSLASYDLNTIPGVSGEPVPDLRTRSITSSHVAEMGTLIPLAKEPYHKDESIAGLTEPLLAHTPTKSVAGSDVVGLLDETVDGSVGMDDELDSVSHGSVAGSLQSSFRGSTQYTMARIPETLSVADNRGGFKPGVMMTTGFYIDDDGGMQLKDGVRMLGCKRHGGTALMYAVKQNEPHLVDYLLRVTGRKDIDAENFAGDTAMTLACARQNKVIMEILLQAGADINYETKTGRTPLLDAVKALPEDRDLINFMVECGALARYKTLKHNKSALQWAEKLKLKHTRRILELAGIVQAQVRELFLCISNGNFDGVKALVEDGELFNPLGSHTMANNLDQLLDDHDDCNAEASRLHGQLKIQDKLISTREDALRGCLMAAADADVIKEDKEDILDNREMSIQDAITVFEQSTKDMHRSDLEEIFRLRKPDKPTRLAALIYGVMYGVLPPDKTYSVENLADTAKWWPNLVRSLVATSSSIRRFKGFSLQKLKGRSGAALIDIARKCYDELTTLIDVDAEAPAPKKAEGGARRGSTFQHHATGSKVLEMWKKKLSKGKPPPPTIEEDTYEPVSNVAVSVNTDSTRSLRPQPSARGGPLAVKKVETLDSDSDSSGMDDLKDEDWDSDAEGATGGEWVKGEWVPYEYIAKEWWRKDERRRVRKEREAAIKANELKKTMRISAPPPESANEDGWDSDHGTPEHSPDSKPKRQQSSVTITARPQVVVLASSPIKRPSNESESKEARHSFSVTATATAIREKSDDPDTINPTGQFIQAMIRLCVAAERYAEQVPLVEVARKDTFAAREVSDGKHKLAQEARMEVEGGVLTRRHMTGLLTGKIQESKVLLQKIKTQRSKLRISKLLNMVSLSGHTALSWAATHGHYDSVELLLSTGSPVGYNEELLHLSATVIQLSFRIYRYLSSAAAIQAEDVMDAFHAKLDPAAVTAKASMVGGSTQQVVEAIFALKEMRRRKVVRLTYCREHIRMPMCEAAYNGKWEVVSRIHERRMFHAKFATTYIHPQPPPPRPMRTKKYSYKRNKVQTIDLMSCLAHGMSEMAAGDYLPEGGWVGANDEREPFGIAFSEISTVMAKVDREVKKAQGEKTKSRLLAWDRRRQGQGLIDMNKAIIKKSWHKCIELAKQGVCSIDAEMPGGTTALLAAGEEDAGALNFTYTMNEDGRAVLAVEFLLDRVDYRPSVNQENRFGQTALMRAASMGRQHTMQALLDRSAVADQCNSRGETALHFAASVGSSECVRMLLERGVDPSIKNGAGKTAYDIAYDIGFMKCLTTMSQFGGGYLGPVRETRGNVVDLVRCPMGCGLTMYSYEVNEHSAGCELRQIKCPHNCGINQMLAKEFENHVREECQAFPQPCENGCGHKVARSKMKKHLNSKCTHRKVDCDIGCGFMIKLCEMSKHHRFCRQRPVDCPLFCGMVIKDCEVRQHTDWECMKRRAPCEYKCSAFIVAELMPEHLNEVCPHRPVKCQWCTTIHQAQHIKGHIKGCDQRQDQCIHGCGEFVKDANVGTHEEVCDAKHVHCPLNCGRDIPRGTIVAHTTSKCDERLVRCPRGCLHEESDPNFNVNADYDPDLTKMGPVFVRARLLELHDKYECVRRAQICKLCAVVKEVAEMPNHLEFHCTHRPKACRNKGCMKTLPLCDRDDHEKLRCRFRVILCRQGCQEKVIAIDVGNHMAKFCKLRRIDCPLGCGENFKWCYLEGHLDRSCPRRGAHNSKKLTEKGDKGKKKGDKGKKKG